MSENNHHQIKEDLTDILNKYPNNFSSFVKNDLPEYKEKIESHMVNVQITPTRYSARNCPTLFSMFRFTEEQQIIQIVYNVIMTVEEIQKIRNRVKKATGLNRVKLPGFYKSLAVNISEINAQLELFQDKELPVISSKKIRDIGEILLTFLEVIYAIHEKSKNNSRTLTLLVKALTPGLEEKIPEFPEKIKILKERLNNFQQNQQQILTPSSPAVTLKSLYAKLNLNFQNIFRFKTKQTENIDN